MHYILIMEWGEDGMRNFDILAVKHTMPEAIEAYNETLQTEKALAEEKSWEIIEEIPDCKFHTAEPDYCCNYVNLYIQCVPD